MNTSTGLAMQAPLIIQPVSPQVTAFLAAVFIAAMVFSMVLLARRRHISRLYAEAQYHYQALSGVVPTRSMSDTADDYDAAAFRYNVVREFPLSRIAARSWPMLGWSAQAFPTSSAADEGQPSVADYEPAASGVVGATGQAQYVVAVPYGPDGQSHYIPYEPENGSVSRIPDGHQLWAPRHSAFGPTHDAGLPDAMRQSSGQPSPVLVSERKDGLRVAAVPTQDPGLATWGSESDLQA